MIADVNKRKRPSGYRGIRDKNILDKTKSMYNARKEAAETQNHIEALHGKKYLERDRADKWINRYERIIAGINSYINYIRDKRKSGDGRGKRPG